MASLGSPKFFPILIDNSMQVHFMLICAHGNVIALKWQLSKKLEIQDWCIGILFILNNKDYYDNFYLVFTNISGGGVNILSKFQLSSSYCLWRKRVTR